MAKPKKQKATSKTSTIPPSMPSTVPAHVGPSNTFPQLPMLKPIPIHPTRRPAKPSVGGPYYSNPTYTDPAFGRRPSHLVPFPEPTGFPIPRWEPLHQAFPIPIEPWWTFYWTREHETF